MSLTMAARTRKGTSEIAWDENVRLKIKTSMLLNRLYDHVLDKCKLSITQIRSIEILLRKTLPDLSSIEMNITHKHEHTDWSDAELVAIVDNSRNGGSRVIDATASEPESNPIHGIHVPKISH